MGICSTHIRIYLWLLAAVFISCNVTLSEKDIKSIEEEKKARAIKSIKPVDIQTAANEIGKDVARITDSIIDARLKKAIAMGELETVIIDYGNLISSLTDSIGLANKVRIKRIAPMYSANISKTESAILEAYQFNVENKLELEDNVQELAENQLLFTRPLLINETTCLKCHEAPQASDRIINDWLLQYYPKFNLSGYTEGSLIGIWSITVPKKEIVKGL